MAHGWDEKNGKDRTAGVKLLRDIATSPSADFFPAKGKNYSRCRQTLLMYAKFYEVGEEDNLLLDGQKLLIPDKDNIGDRVSSADKAIEQLKKLFDRYNSSIRGQEDEYYFYYIDHVRLGLGKRLCKEAVSESVHPAVKETNKIEVGVQKDYAKQGSNGEVFFKETRLLNYNYENPKRISIISFILIIILISVGALLLKDYKQNGEVYYLSGVLLLLLSSVPIVVAITTAVISREKFKHFVGEKYFLKFDSATMSVVSYDSSCPLCTGKINLTNRWHLESGKRVYIAVCQGDPKNHLFNFDHETCIGRLI